MSEPSDRTLDGEGFDKVRSDIETSLRQTAETLERTKRLLLAMAMLRPSPLTGLDHAVSLQPFVETSAPEPPSGPPEVASSADSPAEELG